MGTQNPQSVCSQVHISFRVRSRQSDRPALTSTVERATAVKACVLSSTGTSPWRYWALTQLQGSGQARSSHAFVQHDYQAVQRRSKMKRRLSVRSHCGRSEVGTLPRSCRRCGGKLTLARVSSRDPVMKFDVTNSRSFRNVVKQLQR